MVLFTGDWACGNLDVQIAGASGSFFANLEGPISSDNLIEDPNYSKVGPLLQSATLPKQKFEFVSIANNHIMDYGAIGLSETIAQLNLWNIPYGGAAKDLENSRNPRELIIDGQRVFVISCAERQFGESRMNRDGFAAFGPWIFSLVSALKEQKSVVIVSFHGGIENSAVPSPDTQEIFRTLVDLGADLIWGHHTHVPQGWEFYKNGLILYGLGNFATDPTKISHAGLGKYSLVVDVDLRDLKSSKFLVSEQTKTFNTIKVAVAPLEISPIREHLENSNRAIGNATLLQEKWLENTVINFRNFYREILSLDFSLRRICKDIAIYQFSRLKHRTEFPSPYEKSKQMLIYHLFSTESHRSAIRDYLALYGQEK